VDATFPENRDTGRAGRDEVDVEMRVSGRIGNVTAALLASPGEEGAGSRKLLNRFFDELVSHEISSGTLAAVRLESILQLFEASGGERVLLCASAATGPFPPALADLFLGLVCWPEADAVIVSDASRAGLRLCGIFRREVAMLQARDFLGRESDGVSDWIDRLAPERVELAQMGFAPDQVRSWTETR
jgi:hypothetical protein